MPELDFSKIFGETATSKASFTDENYLNGWGYLGSTPPPYQLFDYLQSLNDKKAKYLYDGINESKNNLLTHNTDSYAHANIRQMFNNYLTIDETETKLTTHNTDSSAHTPILNAIKAITGTSSYDVAPSKTIEAIIPLLGFGGIVESAHNGISSYVKFANGFIMQKGRINDPGIPSDSKVNFLIPMKDYSVFMTDFFSPSKDPLAYSIDTITSTTYFMVRGIRVKNNSDTTVYGAWLAIGWSV